MTAAIPKWNQVAAEVEQQLNTVCNVVLPLDGSAAARTAIPVACGLARLFKAVPHLLYIGQASPDGKDMLAELTASSRGLPGAVLDSCEGDPSQAVARLAGDLPKALIVMCTQMGDQLDGFGSLTDAVLSGAPARIVLVPAERGESAWSLRRLVLAHDGTSASDCATAPAAGISLLSGAEVIALHVAARKAVASEEPGSMPAPRYLDQPQHEWPAWTSEFVERMTALGAPSTAVHFNLVVASGQPGSEIAQLARDRQPDLVVMAWDGEWKSAQHMATRVVVRTSGCPVLLVRASNPSKAGGV